MQSEIMDVLEELDDLLSREKTHLLKGDLPKFSELLNEKEALLQRLSEAPSSDSANMQQVQMRMQYNQSLLEAAMRGIRSAADRLQDMRAIREGIETYDSRGRRQVLPNAGAGGFERRA